MELINTHYRSAAAHAPPDWGKVWHKYGIFNMMALRHRLEIGRGQEPKGSSRQLIANAMHAFFQSVGSSSSDTRHETLQARLRTCRQLPHTHASRYVSKSLIVDGMVTSQPSSARPHRLNDLSWVRCATDLRTLFDRTMQKQRRGVQDVLRLLNLWFRYGGLDEVQHELDNGFRLVPIDTWLVVLPQMMARLHTAEKEIIDPLSELLVKIGRNHPQALMYPLLVRAASHPASRAACADLFTREFSFVCRFKVMCPCLTRCASASRARNMHV